jgi:hypothetical protein
VGEVRSTQSFTSRRFDLFVANRSFTKAREPLGIKHIGASVQSVAPRSQQRRPYFPRSTVLALLVWMTQDE